MYLIILFHICITLYPRIQVRNSKRQYINNIKYMMQQSAEVHTYIKQSTSTTWDQYTDIMCEFVALIEPLLSANWLMTRK